MVLEILKQQTYSAEADEPQKVFETADETTEKPTNKMVLALLFVAILLVSNMAYNFSVAAKGDPILQTIVKNPIFDFAGSSKENPLQREETMASVGVVKGILHNGTKPTALIGTELVHEGAVISGAKIIKIHKDKVEFEKDGFSWTQHVMEKPDKIDNE